MINRRKFVKQTVYSSAAVVIAPSLLTSCTQKPWFQISLAEWSFHRALQGEQLDNFEFPVKAKRDFGITAVEYVSTFFDHNEVNPRYLDELKRITDYHGVKNVLIMVDGEGDLGAQDEQKRGDAVENHYKWIEAAHHLGCFAIRVNASGPGSAHELGQNVVKGLYQLAAYAQPKDISVIVENHGGHSADGQWLAKVIKTVNLPNCGTLPDFGNFTISNGVEYDRYRGVKELMPFAKDVSAKTYDFDESGNETTIDYDRMMKIVKRSGYRGYMGIEYEGDRFSEEEGIMLTKKLLEQYL